jgi:hypothetical protein
MDNSLMDQKMDYRLDYNSGRPLHYLEIHSNSYHFPTRTLVSGFIHRAFFCASQHQEYLAYSIGVAGAKSPFLFREGF